MNDPFEILASPVFFIPAALSAVVLLVLRLIEDFGRRVERGSERVQIHGRTYYRQKIGVRLRFAAWPALTYGRPVTFRFLNPTYASEILMHEPVSLLGPTSVWLTFLFGAPGTAACLALVTFVWRLHYDAKCLQWMSPSLRWRTLSFKALWLTATGVWYASIVVGVVALFAGLLLLLGFGAAGIRKSRRHS